MQASFSTSLGRVAFLVFFITQWLIHQIIKKMHYIINYLSPQTACIKSEQMKKN